MRKNIALLGAAGISASLVAGSAEAKLIRYEINGQRYSYSTNNIQQTKEARQRIEAAAAAEAARAQAHAEAAENPLVRIFGSPAQRQAAEAQGRVQQAVSTEGQSEIASTSSVGRRGAARRRFVKPAAPRQQTRAVRQASLERAGRPETGRGQTAADPIAATRDESPGKPTQIPAPPAEPIKLVTPATETPPTAPALPLDNSPRAAGGTGGGSLMDFVNQVRKAPPEGMPPRM